MRVLILDNHDSFVFNLAQYIGMLGHEPKVVRSDQISVEEVEKLSPSRIVISPGPGNPSDAKWFGCSERILREIARSVPTLGVCLGHQGIISAYGGSLKRAPDLKHGKTSRVYHDGKSIYKGIENPITACRYHSLVADPASIPSSLKVTALSLEDGQVMGVRHRQYPIEGVQFHPESVLTKQGLKIIHNFLVNGVQE
ncbi:MAG: aminodeoxychorismate/anthranilate synthase component II [Conexivisphaerales archaeon]